MSGNDTQDPPVTGTRPDMLHTGMFFASRFKIINSLGLGAMGKVYLASDLMLGEGKIALKILSSDLESDPVHLARFLREVQLTRQVTHPNVVRTYDIGNHGNCHYFTMEYVEGQTVAQMINGKACEPKKCIEILTQLCAGLCAIHEIGIVHRDLKSSNVLITKNGQVKIADFGIARPDASNLTVPDELVGSATHMAPEVWKQSEVSQSSDLYSLGVIAYELLTGTLPFEGKTAYSLMWKHLKEQPVNPMNTRADIPAWLANLCLSLLSKEEDDRPKSAQKILEILKQNQEKEAKEDKPAPKTKVAEITAPKSVQNGTPKIIPSVKSTEDIWAIAKPSASTASFKKPLDIQPLAPELKKPDRNLIKESLKIVDYVPSNIAEQRSFDVNPHLKQVLFSFFASTTLAIILIAIGRYFTPIYLSDTSNIHFLRKGVSHLFSISILCSLLLTPFFLICSIMQGLRYGFLCLGKLYIISIAIFLFIFAGKILSVSVASSATEIQNPVIESMAAIDATMINLSEVLTMQAIPTSFIPLSINDNSRFAFAISNQHSFFQKFIQIVYIAFILLVACAIICNIQIQKISHFRTYFLLIPIAASLLANWFCDAWNTSVNEVNPDSIWNLMIGTHNIAITNSSIFVASIAWGSMLICAFATHGGRIQLRSK